MSTTRHQLIIEGSIVTKVTIEEGAEYNGATYRREREEGAVQLDRWIDSCLAARGEQIFTPSLAEGHILARKSAGERQSLIIELPPAIRRVLERVDQSSSRARLLAFPWVYLVARLVRGAVDTIKVFYRNSAAESVEAELSLPNLPNIYGRGEGYKLCTGYWSGCDSSWSLQRKADWLVQGFFDSPFNTDLIGEHWNTSRRLAGHPQTFAEWEKLSKTDPKFILGISWRSADPRLTIQAVLDKGVA